MLVIFKIFKHILFLEYQTENTNVGNHQHFFVLSNLFGHRIIAATKTIYTDHSRSHLRQRERERERIYTLAYLGTQYLTVQKLQNVPFRK